MSELEGILLSYERVSRAGRIAALASVVSVRGSTYRRIGAHMLVTDDGEVTGAISGGCLERDVVRHAIWVMQLGSRNISCTTRPAMTRIWRIRSPSAATASSRYSSSGCCRMTPPWHSLPTACAGGSQGWWRPSLRAARTRRSRRETVFCGARASSRSPWASKMRTCCFEIVEPPPQLAIFGGGYDAVPLAALAKSVGARVIVVDDRPGHATRTRFPTADRLMMAQPQAAVEALALEGNSLAVVMNHNYRRDLAALEALLPTPVPYLGVLGPRRRTERLLADLAVKGIAATQPQLARLYSPVGLDLGAETPEEVALAVVAEMKAVLAGRGGGPSRERAGSLHQHTEPISDPSEAMPTPSHARSESARQE